MMVYSFTITSYLTPSEANSCSESLEIPNLLQNWKAHSCVHYHWFLTSARLIQSTSIYPISLINILILSSHLCLVPPSFIFSSYFLTKTVCICSLQCLLHNICWTVQILKVLIMQFPSASCHFLLHTHFLQHFCTSPLLCTLLHSIISFLFVKDKVLNCLAYQLLNGIL